MDRHDTEALGASSHGKAGKVIEESLVEAQQDETVEVADEVVDAAKPALEIAVADPEMMKLVDGVKEMYRQAHGVHFDLTTTKGDKAARQLRKMLVSSRTMVERVRKERNEKLRAQVAEEINQCNLGAAALTRVITSLEQPLDTLIRLDEERRERERKEREEAERHRVAALQQRIRDITDVAVRAVDLPSAEIQQKLDLVVRFQIDESFAEQAPIALNAKNETVSRLQDLLAKAKRLEAEREEAERNKRELERLQAEQRAAAEAEERRRREELAAREREAAAERQRLEAERREQEKREAEARRRQDLLAERIASITRARKGALTATAAGLAKLIDTVRGIETPPELGDFGGLVVKAREDAIEELDALHAQKVEAERQAAERAAADQARQAEEAAERMRQQHNEMLMSEITGIRQQLFIAQTGREPHYKGGSIEDTEKILRETRDWLVTEEHFGALFHSAEAVKSSTVAGLEQYLEQLRMTPAALPAEEVRAPAPPAAVAADPVMETPQGSLAAEQLPPEFAEHALDLVRAVAAAASVAKLIRRPDTPYQIPRAVFDTVLDALSNVPLGNSRAFARDGSLTTNTED